MQCEVNKCRVEGDIPVVADKQRGFGQVQLILTAIAEAVSTALDQPIHVFGYFQLNFVNLRQVAGAALERGFDHHTAQAGQHSA